VTPKFNEAYLLAYELHQNQTRKRWPAPYISHCMGVSAIVMEYHGNENQAIAAFLHDTLEDQWRPNLDHEIKDRFGIDVLMIVRNCTDWYPGEFSIYDSPTKPEWKERKTNFINSIPCFTEGSWIVIAADKLYNARSILKDFRTLGPDIWLETSGGKEGVAWYYSSILNKFREIGLALWPIVQELSRTVEELLLLINEKPEEV
jgi:(p)ppGpp synthase/HD superfamily hydrolase